MQAAPRDQGIQIGNMTSGSSIRLCALALEDAGNNLRAHARTT